MTGENVLENKRKEMVIKIMPKIAQFGLKIEE